MNLGFVACFVEQKPEFLNKMLKMMINFWAKFKQKA